MTGAAQPDAYALGERALLFHFAGDVSLQTSERVSAAAILLRDIGLKGVQEVVPAYNSLLVVFEPEEVDEAQLHSIVHRSREVDDNTDHSPVPHIVPVRYGGEAGPDLDDVGRLAGLAPKEVVRLHTNASYTVAFLGFLPGFPYMLGLPDELAVPRHATPRTSVAAGSVGIAARQTGVYPFVSPGGWQLIGQTPLAVWDALAERPALFSPGDRVRLVSSEDERPAVPAVNPTAQVNPVFEVIQPGALTTVQDRGRTGYAHLGVGPAGAFDVSAAERANLLVGNVADAAVLEITLTGPVLRTLAPTTIALSGADVHCCVDGAPVPNELSWLVRARSTITFAGPAAGIRSYLAVAGGIDVPEVLGSRSTSAYGGFGGYAGRPLRAGDVLGTARPHAEPAALAGRILGEQSPPITRSGVIEVRYVRLLGPDSAGPQRADLFEHETWEVSVRSDRMGIRLTGQTRLAQAGGELPSFPVVRGAIQLPPDGQPIVLGPDHQTTGGYAVLGIVAEVDQPALAQFAPGTSIRFVSIDRETARTLAREAVRERGSALRKLRFPQG